MDKIVCVKSFDGNSFYYKGLKKIKKSWVGCSAYAFLKYFYFFIEVDYDKIEILVFSFG